MPSYLSWIKYLFWSYYGFEALMVNQWKYLNCEIYNPLDIINCNEEKELNLTSYGFRYLWRNIIILLIMILSITLFAYIALELKARRKKYNRKSKKFSKEKIVASTEIEIEKGNSIEPKSTSNEIVQENMRVNLAWKNVQVEVESTGKNILTNGNLIELIIKLIFL